MPLTERPIPASLLARLAAAAKGLFDTDPVYFVARYERGDDNHDIGPYTVVLEEAQKQLSGRGGAAAGYDIFGPYETRTSNMQGGRKEQLEGFYVKLKGVDTPLDEQYWIDAADYDALFWGLGSIEKFLHTYYIGLGKQEVDRVDRKFLRTDVYLLAHDPQTELIALPTDTKERMDPLASLKAVVVDSNEKSGLQFISFDAL